MPKTIDCEIKDDLIDSCISGDIVIICGVMKTELQNDMGRGGGRGGGANKNKALHASYIDVHSIKTSNSEMLIERVGDASNQTSNDKLNLAEVNAICNLA